jgi:hypothetical protein
MNTSRLISADLLKTVSIIGVVWIHGAATFGCESDFSKALQNLFRFAVPCFFIMWAFFFEKSYANKSREQRIKYLKRRFIHDFIIYLVWSLCYFFITVDWETLTFSKLFTTHLTGFGWAGQYFLVVLLQLTILFPLIRYCYSVKILRWVIVVITAIVYVVFAYFYNFIPALICKFGVSPFLYWIVYVFAGIALARNEFVKMPKWLCFLVFLIPLEFALISTNSNNAYIFPCVFVGAIALCAVVLQTAIKINNKYNLLIISVIDGGG